MAIDIQPGLVYRYLLGDLPEAEQLALEHKFLSDDEAFERVWEIENEMVDRYARGRLNGHEKELFERNYLASPVHRERALIARRLARAADSRAEIGGADSRTRDSVSWWSTPLASLRRGGWRWAMISAMLVLAIVSGVLFDERVRLHKQINQLDNERASQLRRTEELENEIGSERDKADKLAAELESLREASRGAGLPSQTGQGQKELRPVVSFLLTPMLTRGGGEAQQLPVANGTSIVVLQMRAQDRGEQTFQVELRTVEGAPVWRKGSIKPHQGAENGLLVSVNVPAAKLPPGDYILTLSATRGGKGAEEINRYFFRVVKQ